MSQKIRDRKLVKHITLCRQIQLCRQGPSIDTLRIEQVIHARVCLMRIDKKIKKSLGEINLKNLVTKGGRLFFF